jgi:hypothetical protein
MRRHILAFLALSIAVIAPYTFHADAAQPPACELHVWPADVLDVGTVGTQANRDGVTNRGGLIGGMFSSSNPDRLEVLNATLYQERQAALISETGPAQLLSLPADCTVILHADAAYDREKKTRNATSASSDYHELSIDAVYFNAHPLYGKDILTYFTYRRFGDEPSYLKQVSKMKRVKMKGIAFATREEVAQSVAAIEGAFAETFRKFARESVKP